MASIKTIRYPAAFSAFELQIDKRVAGASGHLEIKFVRLSLQSLEYWYECLVFRNFNICMLSIYLSFFYEFTCFLPFSRIQRLLTER